MPVTFSVNDVERKITIDRKQIPYTPKRFLQCTRREPIYVGEFLTSSFSPNDNVAPTSGDPNKVIAASTHGLIHTVVKAYNEHHHLSLRPDDIWLCVLTQLSFYVNAHAEGMRHHFVNHDGQKALVVQRDGTRHSVDWEDIIDGFDEEIEKHLKDSSVHDWLTPTFTTTTSADIVAANVSVMGVMKKYFEYISVMIACGIPSITLEGTRDDWVQLRGRLERLKSFGEEELTRWYGLLTVMFDRFIRAFDGEVDLDGHWEHIVKYKSMSGGDYIKGWIAYLTPFNEDGKWMLRGGPRASLGSKSYQFWRNWAGEDSDYYWVPHCGFDTIPIGSVEVEVTIDDNGERLKGWVVAGLMGWQWQHTDRILSPYVGWAVYTKDEEAKKEAEKEAIQTARKRRTVHS